MTVKARVAATFAALLVALGVIVGPAAQAHAWSYCTQNRTQGVLTLYSYQGYCGTMHTFPAPSTGGCKPFTGTWSPSNDFAGAAYNDTHRSVMFYEHSNCTGKSAYLATYTSHPNFVNIDGTNIYKQASAVYWLF